METNAAVAATGLFFDAGVRNETASTRNAGKFLERLLVAGNTGVVKEIESMGGELSVNVGREQTSLLVSGGDAAASVGTLAGLIKNPGAHVDAHKDGVLASLAASEPSTREVLDDRLNATAFRDCSLSYFTVGPYEHAASLTQGEVGEFAGQAFSADKAVVVATGAVQHDAIVKAAAGAFGNLQASSPWPLQNKPYFCGAEMLYRNDEMGPTAYINIGVESASARSADNVTLQVMSHVIGNFNKDTGLVPGNLSGNRVINNISNKMQVGCADEFSCYQKSFKDTGIFGFYAACDEVAVEHCVGELMFGMNLLSFSVTDEEVARAKRSLKLALFGSTTAAGQCADIGRDMLAIGRSVPAAEMLLRIDAIDAEEVKRVAWQYCNDAEVATTALGPLHGFPQYLDLRKMAGMHRY